MVGADLSWRVNATQRLSGFVLSSTSRPHGRSRRPRDGRAGRLRIQHAPSRAIGYGNTTIPTSGWTPRSSIGSASQRLGIRRIRFYPPKTKYAWLLRVAPFSFSQAGHDGCRRQRAASVDGRAHAVEPAGKLPVRSVRRVRGMGRHSGSIAHDGGRSAASSSIAG